MNEHRRHKWRDARAIADQLEFEANVLFEGHQTPVVAIVLARLAARAMMMMEPEHRAKARDAFVYLMNGDIRQMEIDETLKEVWDAVHPR